MMMQHRGKDFAGAEAIVIRPEAYRKQDNAIRAERIRVTNIGMASQAIADDYPELAAWFCLRTQSGREFLVEKQLIEAGVRALVPTRKGDKIMKRHRIIPAPTLPVLSGYVLVWCVPSPSAMAGLRRFDRVLEVVGGAETPYPIPHKFVSKFIDKAVSGAYDFRVAEPVIYKPGDLVKIVEGPFASFGGKVLAQRAAENRIWIEANIFGRATPLEMDVRQIEMGLARK